MCEIKLFQNYFSLRRRHDNWPWLMLRSRSHSRLWDWPTRWGRSRLGRTKHLLDRHRYWSHRGGTSEWIAPQGDHLGEAAGTSSHRRWSTWWVRVLVSCYLLFCGLSFCKVWSLAGSIFTAQHSYATAVLGVVILSVCHMRALWQNQTIQTMHCGYFDTTRKGSHSSFLTPTVVGGRHPFRLRFAL